MGNRSFPVKRLHCGAEKFKKLHLNTKNWAKKQESKRGDVVWRQSELNEFSNTGEIPNCVPL